MNEQAWAVVVCYHPDERSLRRLVTSLSTQVPVILIMNNGGIPESLLTDFHRSSEVLVVDMGGNAGIGHALNIAFEHMANRGIEFGVTFDQDSFPPAEHVGHLIKVWRATSRQSGEKTGAVGPSFYDPRGSGFYHPFFRAKGWTVEKIYKNSTDPNPCVDLLITSGMLVPVSLWEKCRFNADLFVDHVDTEWCFRTGHLGFQHHGCFDVEMPHELSEDTPVKLLGITFLRYSALRRYFYFRNGIYVATRGYVPVVFRIRIVVGMIIRGLASPFIDEKPKNSLKMIFQGILDGISSRFGPYKP